MCHFSQARLVLRSTRRTIREHLRFTRRLSGQIPTVQVKWTMYIVSFPVPQPIDTRVVRVSAVALGLVLEPDPHSGLIPRHLGPMYFPIFRFCTTWNGPLFRETGKFGQSKVCKVWIVHWLKSWTEPWSRESLYNGRIMTEYFWIMAEHSRIWERVAEPCRV